MHFYQNRSFTLVHTISNPSTNKWANSLVEGFSTRGGAILLKQGISMLSKISVKFFMMEKQLDLQNKVVTQALYLLNIKNNFPWANK